MIVLEVYNQQRQPHLR